MDILDHTKIDWKVPIERSLLINKEIDNPSLRLYLILLSYARDKITAFPSRETLANDLGCKVRNIDLIKNKLKDIGLLDWDTKYNGSNKYNIYKLLQYQPIKKQQYKTDKTVKEDCEQKEINVNINSKIKDVIEIFKQSYKEFCENSDEDLKGMIQTGWINNPNYFYTPGDLRNLQQYYETFGDSGLEKLSISFKFLGSYLKDAIEYGNFHTSQGSELVPTISLFTKAKFQHDKIMQWTIDELKYKASNIEEMNSVK